MLRLMNPLKRCACLCLMLLFALGVKAQKASIYGTVIDRNNQSVLGGITVQLNPDSISTITDTAGNFSFNNIEPGSYSLRLTGIGFEEKLLSNIVLTTGNLTTLNIELDAVTTELGNVTVTSRKNSVRATTLESPLSIQRLTTEEIRANPGGNFDISKVIQSLPGVGGGVGGGSFRNDIIIRGGSPSENVFYLDGIEVPVINHFST